MGYVSVWCLKNCMWYWCSIRSYFTVAELTVSSKHCRVKMVIIFAKIVRAGNTKHLQVLYCVANLNCHQLYYRYISKYGVHQQDKDGHLPPHSWSTGWWLMMCFSLFWPNKYLCIYIYIYIYRIILMDSPRPSNIQRLPSVILISCYWK